MPSKKGGPTHYAVFRGRVPGVYDNWDAAEAQVKGYPRCWFKGYPSLAAAKEQYKEYLKNPERPTAGTSAGPLALSDSDGSAPTSPVKKGHSGSGSKTAAKRSRSPWKDEDRQTKGTGESLTGLAEY